MIKNIQAALSDWHSNVVSKMVTNDPSKLAEYALHISRIVAYDNLIIKEELAKMNIALTRKLVDKASNPDVIIRMLNNLKTSFFECQDLDSAELVNEMILDINGNDQHGLRDKGMVFLHKKRYEEALKFFSMYLDKFPEANDVDTILELIRKIK